MTKYAHKTSLWATGHASSNNDNLLYLELVQCMVTSVRMMPDWYVKVSIQFAMICCIQFDFLIDIRNFNQNTLTLTLEIEKTKVCSFFLAFSIDCTPHISALSHEILQTIQNHLDDLETVVLV